MAEERCSISWDADETDELLDTEVVEGDGSTCDVGHLPLSRDPCDLLLDSMDAQLSRLKVQNPKNEQRSEVHGGSDEASFSRGCSLRRDTGLETQTTKPLISWLDLGPPEDKSLALGKMSFAVCQEAPRGPFHRLTQPDVTGRTMGVDPEGAESRREQCLWRLGRLLGEAHGVPGGEPACLLDPRPPPDSVRTEDFVSRFREEMVSDPWGHPEATGSLQGPTLEGEEEEERWWIGGSAPSEAVGVTTGTVTPVECSGQKMEVGQGNVGTGAGRRHRGTRDTCDHPSVRSGLSTPDTQGGMAQWSQMKADCLLDRAGSGIRLLHDHEFEHLMESKENSHTTQSYTGVVVSVLERQEMERQLDTSKAQLFAEQRRSRDQLDSMRELLDVAGEDLQRAREDQDLLRSRCDALEEELRQKQECVESLEVESGTLREQLEDCRVKLGSLQKIAACTDLQLLAAQEEAGAQRKARDVLQGELQTLKCRAKSQAQEQERQRAAEEKDVALREQVFTRQREAVQMSLKRREDEARVLRESLETQKEAVQKLTRQTNAEATEKVRKAVEAERCVWDKENMAALQQLGERNQETLEKARRELEEERKDARALKKHMAKLKTKLKELKEVCCSQRSKQDSVLAVLRSSLEEEGRAALERQRQHMEQEFAGTLRRAEQLGQLAEREAGRLRQLMGEREESHQRTTASLQQQLRRVAREVMAEGQQHALLVDRHGTGVNPAQLPQSPTAAGATEYLQDRQDLKRNASQPERGKENVDEHASLRAEEQEERRVWSQTRRSEEQLGCVLPRGKSKTQEQKTRKLDSARRHAAMESGECWGHRGPSDSPGASDKASRKILHHLQTRIRQLRAENQSSPSIACLRSDRVLTEGPFS